MRRLQMEEIDYIASFLKIDTSNKYLLKDIIEIENKPLFIDFMKKNMRHMELDFLNPVQKLEKLKQLFSVEQNSDRVEKAENHAYLLAEKFRSIKPMIKRMFEEFKTPLIENFEKDGIRYFEPFELKTLNKVGDIRKLVFFDDNMTLEEKISKQFTNMIYLSTNRSIEYSQKPTKDTLSDTSVKSLVDLALKGNK